MIKLSLPHKLAKHTVGVWGCLFHLALKYYILKRVRKTPCVYCGHKLITLWMILQSYSVCTIDDIITPERALSLLFVRCYLCIVDDIIMPRGCDLCCLLVKNYGWVIGLCCHQDPMALGFVASRIPWCQVLRPTRPIKQCWVLPPTGPNTYNFFLLLLLLSHGKDEILLLYYYIIVIVIINKFEEKNYYYKKKP